jgi:hypothetical protein
LSIDLGSCGSYQPSHQPLSRWNVAYPYLQLQLHPQVFSSLYLSLDFEHFFPQGYDFELTWNLGLMVIVTFD